MSFGTNNNRDLQPEQQQEFLIGGDNDFLITTVNDMSRKTSLKACNYCKKIKKKCDGNFLTNSSCSNCISQKNKCDYSSSQRKTKMRSMSGRMTEQQCVNSASRILTR